MKFFEFPAVGDDEGFTVCADCFRPSLNLMLVLAGQTPADTIEGMIEQTDELQAATGHEDPHRPDITDGVPGLTCMKCGNESVDRREATA